MHQGNWVINVSSSDVKSRDGSAPNVHYHGSGSLKNIALDQVAALMNDAWISGAADGTFDWDGAGNSFRALLAGSKGQVQFVIKNGGLTHVTIPGISGPLPVHRFAGELELNHNVWKLSEGRLESRDGIYQVSGTASAASGFDCVLKRADERSWNLTGTLSKPRVASIEQTEAKRTETEAKTLKP